MSRYEQEQDQSRITKGRVEGNGKMLEGDAKGEVGMTIVVDKYSCFMFD